jgi:pyrroloquinoline quinone (PQQ) biosynthesis protein C
MFSPVQWLLVPAFGRHDPASCQASHSEPARDFGQTWVYGLADTTQQQLWVINGHLLMSTFSWMMSALSPKADILRGERHVC